MLRFGDAISIFARSVFEPSGNSPFLTKTIDARTVEGTDKAVYQQIIDEYGPDSHQAHVEVYGEFPDANDDQFIPASLVDDAMAREPHKDMSAPIVVGVDPARFGADSTVIAVRRGRDIISIKRYWGDDTAVPEARK